MSGNKSFDIRDLRKGTGKFQPAYIDVLIGDVLVKGIEVCLDDNENLFIRFPVHEVSTRYGTSELEIISVPDPLREHIVCELMDNFEDQISASSDKKFGNSNNGYHEFMPQITK